MRTPTPEDELMQENCRLSLRSRLSSGHVLAFSSTFAMTSSGLEANLKAASLELKTKSFSSCFRNPMCGFPAKDVAFRRKPESDTGAKLQTLLLIPHVHDGNNTWEKKSVFGHERVSAESIILQRQLVKPGSCFGQEPFLSLHLSRIDALS